MEKKKEIKFISPEISTRGGMEYHQGDVWGYIKELVKQYPNDQDLGRELRKLLNERDGK